MYTKKIYFSGDNFHKLKSIFENTHGVVNITAGYVSAYDVRSYVNFVSREIENVAGIEIEFNPKKIDLSTLMDMLFNTVDPYSDNKSGVYYATHEDAPQVELHLNFIANRGKQLAVTQSELTINDPNSNTKFARKCYVDIGQLREFSPLTKN